LICVTGNPRGRRKEGRKEVKSLPRIFHSQINFNGFQYKLGEVRMKRENNYIAMELKMNWMDVEE